MVIIDTGLFGPDTVTWRVNGETALILGGGRALIMQVAHPKVGAAVSQYSRFRSDQWGRLRHTLDVMGSILFGDTLTVARAVKRVENAHRRVRGTVTDGAARGQSYHALDPELLLWVWATLVDTTLLIYERYVRPLSSAEVARYYEEQKRFAAACGVPGELCPAAYGDFLRYVEATVSGVLEVTPIVCTVADMVLDPLRLPRAVRPLLAPLTLSTVALVPPDLRRGLGLRWSATDQVVFALSTHAIRLALPWLPTALRRVPSARRAARRVGWAFEDAPKRTPEMSGAYETRSRDETVAIVDTVNDSSGEGMTGSPDIAGNIHAL